MLAKGWGMALFWSLGLHGLVVAALWGWPLRSNQEGERAQGMGLIMRFVEEEGASEEESEQPEPTVKLAKGSDNGGSAGEKKSDFSSLKMARNLIPLPGEAGNVFPGGHESSSNRSFAAGLEGQPGRGKDHASTFFQIPVQGKRILYLIDSSASMGRNGAWAVACRELLASVEGLPSGARFQILVYNSSAQVLVPRLPTWLEPSAANYQEIARALVGLPVEGRTDHLPALRQALGMNPDVLFFLTDADDLEAEQVRQVQLLNRGRTIIHTIELNLANRQRPGMPLQLLARSNQGTYQAVDLSTLK
jgi:hypothetical protein